jgi:hypothetical protein
MDNIKWQFGLSFDRFGVLRKSGGFADENYTTAYFRNYVGPRGGNKLRYVEQTSKRPTSRMFIDCVKIFIEFYRIRRICRIRRIFL